ncbi:MAG: M1 family metallopeptidase [Alphaproteobacteria bacterium]
MGELQKQVARLIAAHVVSACLVLTAAPQAAAQDRGGLPEVGLTYEIDVTINMEDRTFTGRERVAWRNPGSAPVSSVPLHLYLNAFSNGASTWLTERRGGQGLSRFLADALPEDSWGFNEPDTIRQMVDGEARDTTWTAIQPDDGNERDRTLIRVDLARDVAPGERLVLDIAFTARLPEPVARTGCVPDLCFFAQWFPKLGAFETKGMRGAAEDGFAARQFHASTEFYANFADYTVTVDAPEGFVIGATGKEIERRDGDGRQVVTFEQKAVIDFTFTVGRFDEYTSTFDPNGKGPTVKIRYLPFAGRGFALDRAITAVHGSLRVLNEKLGPYPYDTLTVVYPPAHAIELGGMEYPTLFTGIAVDPILFNPPLNEFSIFETVDIHEFGHQYFQQLLATNEQVDAFMDEGFNSYWEGVIKAELFTKEASGGRMFGRPIDDLLNERDNEGYARLREALGKAPSTLFLRGTGGIQIYPRPSVTLRTAAGLFGEDRLHAVFRAYFERWRFKHPGPEDFMAVVREVGGPEMEAFLREGFAAPRHPDFKIALVRSRALETPTGRYPGEDGEGLIVTAENQDDHAGLIADDRARETGGSVWAQITDPGWTDRTSARAGRVAWQTLTLTEGAVEAQEAGAALFETLVRIEGPAWTHLPIEVVFTFEDGVSVTETWDGRAAWRQYRFVRGAKLAAVRLDPDNKIALDYDISNNSRLMKPDQGLVHDMTAWTGAVFQTLIAALWASL